MKNFDVLATQLRAMSHPVRLAILDHLRHGEACVCHFEALLDKRQAYISQQLMTLREAGLVISRREGLQVYYRLADADAAHLVDTVCGPTVEIGLDVLDGCTCPTCVCKTAPALGA